MNPDVLINMLVKAGHQQLDIINKMSEKLKKYDDKRIEENKRLRECFDSFYDFIITRKACDEDYGDYSNAQTAGQKSILEDLKKSISAL